MTPEEFQSLRAEPHPILGASVKVVAPTGKYDSERLLNVSGNRWAVKPEIGYMPMTRFHPQEQACIAISNFTTLADHTRALTVRHRIRFTLNRCHNPWQLNRRAATHL